jgi:hypothetical protein
MPLDYLAPQLITTYAARMPSTPAADFWRPATCAEIDCLSWRNGFEAALPVDDPRCDYIRRDVRRTHRFVETREQRDGVVVAVFTFPPGQTCFAAPTHRVRTGRPERLLIIDGDTRRQRGRRIVGVSEWVDRVNDNLHSVPWDQR